MLTNSQVFKFIPKKKLTKELFFFEFFLILQEKIKKIGKMTSYSIISVKCHTIRILYFSHSTIFQPQIVLIVQVLL